MHRSVTGFAIVVVNHVQVAVSETRTLVWESNSLNTEPHAQPSMLAKTTILVVELWRMLNNYYNHYWWKFRELFQCIAHHQWCPCLNTLPFCISTHTTVCIVSCVVELIIGALHCYHVCSMIMLSTQHRSGGSVVNSVSHSRKSLELRILDDRPQRKTGAECCSVFLLRYLFVNFW